jgi:hypothetical protein
MGELKRVYPPKKLPTADRPRSTVPSFLVLLFNLLVLPSYVRTITIKVHSVQDEALECVAKAQRISKSELVRRSLEQYLANHQASSNDAKPSSLHDRLKNYIPKSGTGVKDLASNPKHLEGFGAE